MERLNRQITSEQSVQRPEGGEDWSIVASIRANHSRYSSRCTAHRRFNRRFRGTYGPAPSNGKYVWELPGPKTPIDGLLACGDTTFLGKIPSFNTIFLHTINSGKISSTNSYYLNSFDVYKVLDCMVLQYLWYNCSKDTGISSNSVELDGRAEKYRSCAVMLSLLLIIHPTIVVNHTRLYLRLMNMRNNWN